MALRFDLRPFEKLLIGETILTNADTKATFIIEGDAPVLRGKDEINAHSVVKPLEKLYLCIQNIFLSRNSAAHQAELPLLQMTAKAEHPECESSLDSAKSFVAKKEYYKALRTLKPMVDADLFCSLRAPDSNFQSRGDDRRLTAPRSTSRIEKQP